MTNPNSTAKWTSPARKPIPSGKSDTYTLRINKDDARVLFQLAQHLQHYRGSSATTRIIADFHRQIRAQSEARRTTAKPQGWPTPAEDPIALSRLSVARKRAILDELDQDSSGNSGDLSHRIRRYYIHLANKKAWGTNDQIDARLSALGLSLDGSREQKQNRLTAHRSQALARHAAPVTDGSVELIEAAFIAASDEAPTDGEAARLRRLAERADADGLDFSMIADHDRSEIAALVEELTNQPLDRVGETLGHIEEDPTLPGDEFHRDDMSEGSRADHSSYGGEDLIAYQEITGSL